ncbi:MAG: recombinase RecT, partial [Spirochaetes bacterium]|nr:recombinase RecT [Spirochaetota bacterium]
NYAVRKYDDLAWAKTVMLCIVGDPKLMACLSTRPGKTSLYHALRLAAATGLSLNPQEGESCLVEIKGKVNYWKEKNGIIRLILETGRVKSIYGDAVRENDKFRVIKSFKGDDYEHIPPLKGRGAIKGFYSAIMETDGIGHVYYMTREEVEAHRDQYAPSWNSYDSSWKKSFEGMGVKTAIKMGAARLSLPKESQAAIDSREGEPDDAPVPATFVEVPGVTAEDVAAKLRERTSTTETEKEIVALVDGQPSPTPAAASAAPAGAAQSPAGAQAAPAPTSQPAKGEDKPAKGEDKAGKSAEDKAGKLDIF